jgi:hypothetical protein
MPYALTRAGNVMAIAECQWGTAAVIQFTTFISSVGVLARVAGANDVIGIHLVLVDSNENSFTAADVAWVTHVLAGQNYDNTTCVIMGKTSVWAESASAAYTALVNAVNPGDRVYGYADGTYGATMSGGAVEITYQ